MSGQTDEFKGRVKKAAGELTGNDKLKREGEVDKVAGKVKQGMDKVKEALPDKKLAGFTDQKCTGLRLSVRLKPHKFGEFNGCGTDQQAFYLPKPTKEAKFKVHGRVASN